VFRHWVIFHVPPTRIVPRLFIRVAPIVAPMPYNPRSRLMVFKRIRDLLSSPACTWAFSVAALWVIQDHPVYIPRPATGLFVPI
jgi:hypothetical protein